MNDLPLDIEKTDGLIAYLREAGIFARGENCRAVILCGGVSNKTVLVQGQDRGIVVKQALPKLRVASDWQADPARILREATGLRILGQLAPPGAITPFVFEDAPLFLLGMEAVPEPHDNWKPVLLRGEISDDAIHQFGTLLGCIHLKGSTLDEPTVSLVRDRRFFEELRVDPYYRVTAGNNPRVVEFYERLMADMKAHALTIVHGDFSPKNVLVHQGRLVLLDHEVIHWGDPTFDAGFALTHLLSKANHLLRHRDAFLRAAENFWHAYSAAAAGVAAANGFESRACRQTLACLLARIDGRSPLEYLSETERAAQKQAALELMQNPPVRVGDLIHQFGSRL